MMWEVHSTDKIRIKDIAEKAGVSVGTVDRVLHNRPNVSAKARKKVENVLREINYKPNMYASALASNRKYTFLCLLPDHDCNAYWTEIEKGLQQAVINLNDFRLSLVTLYYDQSDPESFRKQAMKTLECQPDGVIIVPQDKTFTSDFCHSLTGRQIPYVFLDSNMPELPATAYFGQDAHRSGYFAGRIFMMQASQAHEIMLMKLMLNGKVASRQQAQRETGFRQYMAEKFPDCRILELPLPADMTEEELDGETSRFFDAHPDVRHCITFCSRAYLLGEYFEKHGIHDAHLFGYDMIERNLECLRHGSIDFIIAQHPWKQGYNCVKALFNHLVLKKDVSRNNYMPLELLTAENYIFYTHDEQ